MPPKKVRVAIIAEPNDTYKFAEVPYPDIPVVRGMTHDGLGKHLSGMIKKALVPTADILLFLQNASQTIPRRHQPRESGSLYQR